MILKKVFAFLLCITLAMLLGTSLVFAANGTKIPLKEAVNVVMDFMPNGEVDSFQNGGGIYTFIVVDGTGRYTVIVDAYSGEIESSTKEKASLQTAVSQSTAPQLSVAPAHTSSTASTSAESAALASVGGGTVARVETHYPPHGGVEYKVIVINGDNKYCVHINANSGSVINYHMEQITKVQYSASASISADKAKSIAIQNAGGSGIVTECKLENKPREGTSVYHIHVANGQYEYCVELNATTGSVIKFEQRYKP